MDKDDISAFWQFMKYFVAVAVIFVVLTVIGTVAVLYRGEISPTEWILVVFNFVFQAITISLCFVIKKESKFIKKCIRKLNRTKSVEEIDFILNVNNKFKFIKEAEMVISSNLDGKYALVHYDLNKFTIINNSVGYKVGDEILQQIGRVLRKNLKEEIIGKADGDNFFVLFEYINQENLIEVVCSLTDKIEKLRIWKKVNINPVVKAGIYFINNKELDIRTAIDRADFAKTILNNNYKSDYAIYENEIGNNLIEAKKIEDDMHRALKNKEFKVYLQPKINLKTGCIVGAEALVRWEHPELGLLCPVRFIPILEKNGFIVNLDKYVFEEVCISIRKWLDLGYNVVPVSVNISRIHFFNRSFVSDYKKIKEKYKISNKLIEIEITESVVFDYENEKEVFKVMKKFRDDGFEISMDDFGSGYSSLGLLKDMPIDTLKLDKIFLNNIEDYNSQIIVSNIVNMAKSLELNVVSEGVETSEQVEFLKDIGCDIAQGFIFARPEPIFLFEDLIFKNNINYYELVS